jgi:hypothetical protein
MENIVPQLLQAAGRHRDVLVERQASEVRDQANHHSRLQEEGIL